MLDDKNLIENIDKSTSTRRKFLKVFTISIGGIVGIVLGIPFRHLTG